MVQLETHEDIINAAKSLKDDLMATFGFHVTSGEGYGSEAAYTIKKDEVMFSFPYGRYKDDNATRSRWTQPQRRCEVYDNKNEQVLMSHEQFMEIFKKHFGDVKYEEFEWSYTWGVRVPLVAQKAVGELWRVNFINEPEKLLILRKTERTVVVGSSLNTAYPQKLNLSEAIGDNYFWTYEEAYEKYKHNLEVELRRLEELQAETARRIENVKRLQGQLH